MRLRGLIRKEFLQIVRDPSSIAIAFLMPIFLLLLFGYGVSLDSEHIPLALVVEQPNADTASFTAAFKQSRYFNPVAYADTREAEQALMAGRVNAIVVLRQDFSRQLRQADGAPIQLIVNGVDANTARIISGYVEGAWGKWLEHAALQRGQKLDVPVQMEQRVWFNSELRSRNFLVPGLVAIIMTLIGALLTAMVMSREWERGTMEALLVTPLSMSEVILGKTDSLFHFGYGRAGAGGGYGAVDVRGAAARLAVGAVRDFGAVSRYCAGHGLADIHRGPQPVRRRSGGADRHLPARLPALRFHL